VDQQKESLLKEDLAVAVANGISAKTAQNRFYNLGWNKQRCITEPVATKEPRGNWNKYKHKAVISRSTFYARVAAGMDPEAAATKERDPSGKKRINEIK
jgi:hypothetical protein